MDSLLEPVAETHKQQFCVEMMKRLDIQRRNEHFCDVILEVGSGDDQARLKAHKIVLCAATPFFYNALNTDMKEKKEGVIRLEETSKVLMEEVLEYLYTGHVDINEQNAFDLFAQADYFLLPNLKDLSGKFILQTLSLSNCVMAYYFSAKYHWEELQKGAREFILENFLAVAETEDFLNLSSKEVEEWISSDEITIEGEENVFEVVVKWVEKNGCKKYQCFYDLFQRVRFIYVPRNYVFKVILPHRLVKDRKKCVELVLEAMSRSSDGTEECFFTQLPRNCLNTQEEAIVACGRKKTFCYIPSKNKCFELDKLPSVYIHNPFTYTMSACHGKLYIFGGDSLIGGFSEYYDPALEQWSLGQRCNGNGFFYPQCGVVTFQGFLYAVGGVDDDDREVSAVQKYNPDTNVWQAVVPLSSPRWRVCAVADESHLYVIGGSNATGQYLDVVERFDPLSNTWEKLPSTLAGRSSASGAICKQKVFVFGGLQADSTMGDPCEVYDPVTKVWSGIPCPVAPRYHASAVSFKGQIFVFGGFRQAGGREWLLQVYNVDQNKWEPCPEVSSRSRFYRISALRISRDMLKQRKVL